MLFQVSYGRLMEEIRNEKIGTNSKDKMEVEDLGNALAYYLSSFDRPKTYVYVVLKSDITDVQKSQLDALSNPVDRRITETSRLIAIAQSLDRIEQQLNNPREKIIEKIETQVVIEE